MKNRNFKLILWLLIIILIFTIVYPPFSVYKYDQQIENLKNQFPSFQHLLGTDYLGRDLFVRVLVGIKITMLIGIFSIFISISVGIPYGIICGYYGGRIEKTMSCIMDIIESIPQILYAIILMTIFSSITSLGGIFTNINGSLLGIFITLSLIFWIPVARIVKNETKKIKNKEFVVYAKSKNASFFHIMFKHIIPNCLDTIVVIIMQSIPNSIFIETFLSFIGIGIQPPTPSLGKLINYGISGMRSYSYALIIPSVALIIIILLFNLLGNQFMKSTENKWE